MITSLSKEIEKGKKGKEKKEIGKKGKKKGEKEGNRKKRRKKMVFCSHRKISKTFFGENIIFFP